MRPSARATISAESIHGWYDRMLVEDVVVHGITREA